MSLPLHHPVILFVIPLAFAALCPLLGLWKKSLCFWWALTGMLATAFFTWSLVGRVTAEAPVTYSVGDWPPPWGIQVRVDVPGLLMACAATALVAILLVYSYRHGKEYIESMGRGPYYYTLMLLVTAGMLGVLMSGDLFNMLVFLQIVSVAAAGLVALTGRSRALGAAFRYILAVSASAVLFLLAVGFLYGVTGTLDMRKLYLRIGAMSEGFVPVAVVALALFLLSLAVESALFPASWWLPDAASTGLRTSGVLLSTLVVAMGAFAIFRLLFFVYTPTLTRVHTARVIMSTGLSWIGLLAFVAGAAIAAFQRDLRRVVAYSAVSQVGLVVAGIAASSAKTVAGGLSAAVAGACGISCLFLAEGALGYGRETLRLSDLPGLGRKKPVAAAAFTLGALSFVGAPYTVGFAAKRLLVAGLLDKGWYVPAALVFLGSALALAYLLRVVYLLFSKATGGRVEQGEATPWSMTAPAALLAAGTIAAGIMAYMVTTSLVQAARLFIRA